MKKFDRRYIFYHLVFDFFAILLLMLVFFMENIADLYENGNLPKFILVFSIIFLVIYALKSVYSILYVKTSGYELKESEVVCKRGVLFKKRSILEYSKINAVNKKQNIIQKLFKIAVLTLDSGSTNTSHLPEIVVHERENVVDELVRKIKYKQENPDADISSEETKIVKEERENLYKFSSKTKFVYSLINVVASLAVILFIFICTIIVFSILLGVIKEKVKGTLGLILLISLFVFLGTSLLSFIISVLSLFIGYYNFKVYKNERDIEINYGLLVKNCNTFKLNKIKGVVLSQGIIKRLFKYVTVKLEVIGYNEAGSENQNQSSGVLFPLCKESEVYKNIEKVLPSYVPVKKERSSKSYFPFISWNLFFTTLFSALFLVICVLDFLVLKLQAKVYLIFIICVLVCYLIIISIMAINNYLAYKNNGITIKEDTLYVYNGGFTRCLTVIKAENLIAIEDITTPLRKKRGIYSFNVHYRTNTLTNVVKVNVLDKGLVDELNNLLKY